MAALAFFAKEMGSRISNKVKCLDEQTWRAVRAWHRNWRFQSCIQQKDCKIWKTACKQKKNAARKRGRLNLLKTNDTDSSSSSSTSSDWMCLVLDTFARKWSFAYGTWMWTGTSRWKRKQAEPHVNKNYILHFSGKIEKHRIHIYIYMYMFIFRHYICIYIYIFWNTRLMCFLAPMGGFWWNFVGYPQNHHQGRLAHQRRVWGRCKSFLRFSFGTFCFLKQDFPGTEASESMMIGSILIIHVFFINASCTHNAIAVICMSPSFVQAISLITNCTWQHFEVTSYCKLSSTQQNRAVTWKTQTKKHTDEIWMSKYCYHTMAEVALQYICCCFFDKAMCHTTRDSSAEWAAKVAVGRAFMAPALHVPQASFLEVPTGVFGALGGLVGIGMEVVAVGGFLWKNLGDPKSSKYVFNQDKDVMFTNVVGCRWIQTLMYYLQVGVVVLNLMKKMIIVYYAKRRYKGSAPATRWAPSTCRYTWVINPLNGLTNGQLGLGTLLKGVSHPIYKW